LGFAVVALCALLGAPGAAASQGASCAAADHPGGEWRSYGHDLANTRYQDRETSITPARAVTLAPAWTFSAAGAGRTGDFTGTPVVADGCVYIGSGTGWIFALNADSGECVWSMKLPDATPDQFPGGVNAALAVAGGRVIVSMNHRPGPYVAALDQATGAVLWEQNDIDANVSTSLYGSPVQFDGMVFAGFSAFAGGSHEFHGGFVLLDASTGDVLRRTYTIPPEDWPTYSGGGILATPAIDTDTRYAYVGTAGPYSGDPEHARADSLLKIDLDRSRPTFGEIVAFFKHNPYEQIPGFSVVHFTSEFAASPNLLTDASGRKLVGSMNKNGVFYVVDTGTMAEDWTATLSYPEVLGNGSSSAYDGRMVFSSGDPGILYALAPDSGTVRWASPIVDGLRYQPLAAAGGVVYTLDTKGFIDAYRTSDGLPLLHRPVGLGSGTGADATLTLGGVAVARNAVYATIGLGFGSVSSGYVIAFRPDPSIPDLPLP
jgi:polyvinyl alcohol dehydrogenase (cytochrome)